MSLNTVDTVLETEKRTDEKVAAAQETAHKRFNDGIKEAQARADEIIAEAKAEADKIVSAAKEDETKAFADADKVGTDEYNSIKAKAEKFKDEATDVIFRALF